MSELFTLNESPGGRSERLPSKSEPASREAIEAALAAEIARFPASDGWCVTRNGDFVDVALGDYSHTAWRIAQAA